MAPMHMYIANASSYTKHVGIFVGNGFFDKSIDQAQFELHGYGAKPPSEGRKKSLYLPRDIEKVESLLVNLSAILDLRYVPNRELNMNREGHEQMMQALPPYEIVIGDKEFVSFQAALLSKNTTVNNLFEASRMVGELKEKISSNRPEVNRILAEIIELQKAGDLAQSEQIRVANENRQAVINTCNEVQLKLYALRAISEKIGGDTRSSDSIKEFQEGNFDVRFYTDVVGTSDSIFQKSEAGINNLGAGID